MYHIITTAVSIIIVGSTEREAVLEGRQFSDDDRPLYTYGPELTPFQLAKVLNALNVLIAYEEYSSIDERSATLELVMSHTLGLQRVLQQSIVSNVGEESPTQED